MSATILDLAYDALDAAPEDDRVRLRFFDRFANSELFLLLDHPADGARIEPTVLETDDGRFVLAFDREERLAEFADGPSPYVAMSGRALVSMVVGQSLGVALNPVVSPSGTILTPDMISWLAETLSHTPDETEERPVKLSRPTVPEAVIEILDERLSSAPGLAQYAALAGVDYDSGRSGHILAIIDALPGAESALSSTVQEALIFSGLEDDDLDIAFFAQTHPIVERLSRVAVRMDLPQPQDSPIEPVMPGSDPEKPPRLR